AAVYRRAETQAFWLGAALFGWGYMALASDTWWDCGANRPELITSMILDQIHLNLLPAGNPGTPSASLASLMGRDAKTRAILAKLELPIGDPGSQRYRHPDVRRSQGTERADEVYDLARDARIGRDTAEDDVTAPAGPA